MKRKHEKYLMKGFMLFTIIFLIWFVIEWIQFGYMEYQKLVILQNIIESQQELLQLIQTGALK